MVVTLTNALRALCLHLFVAVLAFASLGNVASAFASATCGDDACPCAAEHDAHSEADADVAPADDPCCPGDEGSAAPGDGLPDDTALAEQDVDTDDACAGDACAPGCDACECALAFVTAVPTTALAATWRQPTLELETELEPTDQVLLGVTRRLDRPPSR